MQRFKRILTWSLLVFVAAAVVAQIRPRETVVVPDGLSLLFWHAKKRCSNCLKMEKIIRQVHQEHGEFRLIELEYDVFANELLAQQLKVGRATVILVERKDQQNVRIQDLTEEVWKNFQDEDAFAAMLQKELAEFATHK